MDIEQLDTAKTAMQNVKQRFFALRNGMLADTLRKSGSPYRIIFGLNVPQLRQVAAVFGKDTVLARALWANDSTRESRLMAPMLVDPTTFTIDEARQWINSLCGAAEEVDLLCFGLLRHVPYITDLIDELADSADPVKRYTALRLAYGRVAQQPDTAYHLAVAELGRNETFTRPIATSLKDEAEYLLEN